MGRDGTAANDVIRSVTALDQAGFHGPYLLALAPNLYNMLYRLYPQGYQVEMQHVESIVGSKVIKAPGIKKGGVLLAAEGSLPRSSWVRICRSGLSARPARTSSSR